MIGSVWDSSVFMAMHEALGRYSDYNFFIIDKADNCIIEKGTIVDIS